ncbi:hypothetical protein EJB05_41912, partial [Eragrostis curvula]
MTSLSHSQFALAFCVVLLAASSASSPPPAVHGDGERVLTVPSASGGETPNRWSRRHTFHAGDLLDFTPWNLSVLVVRADDYKRCAAASPLRRVADGKLFQIEGRGLFFFIAGAPALCEAGQRMVVRVATMEADLLPATAAPEHMKPLLAASSPAASPTQMGTADRDQSNKKSTLKIWIIIVSILSGLGILLLLIFCYIEWRDRKVRAIKMTAITAAKFEPMDCDYREGGGKVCEICIEEYRDQDTLGVLPCTHRFHESCIKEWIKVGVQTYCPICKVPV